MTCNVNIFQSESILYHPDLCALVVKVVMLSSVTDLLRYIDENQLTSEFGGTLDYCHSNWIVLRTVMLTTAPMKSCKCGGMQR